MRKILCTTLAVVFVTMATSAMAQSKSSPLVGLWKVDSFTTKNAAGQVTKPYGEHPGGYNLYTKSGRFLVMLIGANRTAPVSAVATDAEAGKLYATMAALDGTYKVEGNSYIAHVVDAWNQSWAGTDQRRDFKITGKRLTVSFTTKSEMNGQDVLVTASLERVE